MTSYQTTHAAELESLPLFRQLVDRACQAHGIGAETAMALKLAVDEACTNIVEHGYEGMDAGSIILELVVHKEEVIVDITDFGHPFEPYEPEKPDAEQLLEDPSAGGFGLYIIYQTMTHIEYEAGDMGNRLRFYKQLS